MFTVCTGMFVHCVHWHVCSLCALACLFTVCTGMFVHCVHWHVCSLCALAPTQSSPVVASASHVLQLSCIQGRRGVFALDRQTLRRMMDGLLSRTYRAHFITSLQRATMLSRTATSRRPLLAIHSAAAGSRLMQQRCQRSFRVPPAAASGLIRFPQSRRVR